MVSNTRSRSRAGSGARRAPEGPGLPGQAPLEPADLDRNGALTPGMRDGHVHAEALGPGGDEGRQAPWLPPLETVVEDLHAPVQRAGTTDERSRGLAHLAAELLLIHPAVRHATVGAGTVASSAQWPASVPGSRARNPWSGPSTSGRRQSPARRG